MKAYIIRRLLLIIPTLFILTIIVFLSVRFLPGDIIDATVAMMQSFSSETEFDREAIMRYMGLDVPVHVQYGRWIGVLPTPDWVTGESHFKGLLQGTLGESLWGGLSIEERIIGRLPVTIQLGVLSIAIGLVIALPVGIYSAIRQDTAADYAGRSIAIIGLATPNFWLALMVMIYPAIWWGWSPPMDWVPFTEDPLGNLGVLIIPSVILGTAMSAGTMRLTRTMMLEVLRQDYIRTAWSKGLKERVVIIRHTIKNALIPIVTLIGLQLPLLVGGSVIIENIFNLPGLGRLFLMALEGRDYPMVSGINLVLSGVVMLNILLIDLIYPYLDPRVRYE
jgi:peptide/nickel transport system permease protein